MLGKAKRVDMASAKERESFKEMTASFDCEVSQKRARFKTSFISLSRCRRETLRAVPPRTPGLCVPTVSFSATEICGSLADHQHLTLRQRCSLSLGADLRTT